MVKCSRRILATLAAACALVVFGPAASGAQQRPKITTSSLTLPVFNPLVWNIMKARGFDAKHGFALSRHRHELYGRCPECRDTARAAV